MSTICPYPYEEFDEGEPCACFEEKKVKARKEHRCDECYATIRPGETYGRATAVIQGCGWETWCRCPSCLILAEMVATYQEACPLWGTLDASVDNVNYELRYQGKEPLLSPRRFRELWDEKAPPLDNPPES